MKWVHFIISQHGKAPKKRDPDGETEEKVHHLVEHGFMDMQHIFVSWSIWDTNQFTQKNSYFRST